MKKTILLLIITIFSSFLGYSQWSQIGSSIDGEFYNDLSGVISLSADGNIIAIASPGNSEAAQAVGKVRIFRNENGTWTQIGSALYGSGTNERFGRSISLSADGSVIAITVNISITAPLGKVRIYENVNDVWIQVGQDINGESITDHSTIVNLNENGSIVAIGVPTHDGINGVNSGHVKVYKNENGTWAQIGSDINGEAIEDRSGTSISLNAGGNVIAIGAIQNDGINGGNSGHVRVYENINDVWTQIGSDIDGESSGDLFGSSVELNFDGNIVAIGARLNEGNNPPDAGHVRVFKYENAMWTQIGSDIDGEAPVDNSGGAISLNDAGDIIAIGGPGNLGGGIGVATGHVRLYQNQNDTWIQIGTDIDGEFTYDYFGSYVNLNANGNIVAIGAPGYDGGMFNFDIGYAKIFENTTLSREETNTLNFKIYPNPVSSYLHLENISTVEKIIIYDNQGKVIKSMILKEYNVKHSINVSELSSGIYFIKLQTDKLNEIKKFLKV